MYLWFNGLCFTGYANEHYTYDFLLNFALSLKSALLQSIEQLIKSLVCEVIIHRFGSLVTAMLNIIKLTNKLTTAAVD